MPPTAKRVYQLGEFWLAKRPGRDVWHRCWLDTAQRQTRYASLQTTDLSEAKKKLDLWFAGNLSGCTLKEQPKLLAILQSYYLEHGIALVSAGRIEIGMRYWSDFFGDIEVSALRDVRQQEAFHEWLRDKGQGNNTINRTLSVGKAAINRAWRRGIIEHAPAILMTKAQLSPPKGRPLEIKEIAALIEATDSEHLIDFILWGLATGARPDALFELTWKQIDFDNALIQLNPEGRPQTTKRRPVVRLPEFMAEMYGMAHFQGLQGPVISYSSRPVKSVRNAWRLARAKAGLDDQVQPYSLRHTVARWLRKEGVPAWTVAAQLGHSISQHSMTERYASYSPDYLEGAVQSVDHLLNLLRDSCVTLSVPRVRLEEPQVIVSKEKYWRTQQDSNLRPLPSEGSTLSS